MAVITTSNRGQIVIPKDIRKNLKFYPGKNSPLKQRETRSYSHLCRLFCGGHSQA